MNKALKYIVPIVRVLIVSALIVCYVVVFAVPYFQTFGKGYEYQNNFYAGHYANIAISNTPNRYLTLSGMVLSEYIGGSMPSTVSNALFRIHLTKENFDNLFTKPHMWTHYSIDAKWIRENTITAWLGFRYNSLYNLITLQYILKMNNGDVVVCYGSAPTWKGVREFSFVEYYSPCGTVWDYFQRLDIQI